MSYTSGIINIPSVTGNIVITAVAASVTVTSISAVFNQGDNKVYTTDTLDSLKQYLTVTASYSNGTSGVVTGYTLSGTLTKGTSTITVSYGGQTTTFNVTVSVEGVEDLPDGYSQVEWISNYATNVPPSPTYLIFAEMPLDDVLELRFYMTSRGGGGYMFKSTTASTQIGMYNGGIYYDLNSVRAGFLALTENERNTVRIGNHYVESVELGTSSTKTTQTGLDNVTYGFGASMSAQEEHFVYVKMYHGTTLTHYYVACVRDADSRSGFYDIVGDEFVCASYSFPTGEVIS